MSKLSNGLNKSSRIYNPAREEFFSTDGTGTDAWVCVLKQASNVHISSILFNDNDGVDGDYSVAIIRRGYNSESGGRSVRESTTDIVPAANANVQNDWATISPDRTVSGNQPQLAHYKALNVDVTAGSVGAYSMEDVVGVLNPYDELWLKCSDNVNYSVIWS